MQAIILKKQAFSEGNEIITMYSRELGKVRGIARAAKKPLSKLAFGLQEFFCSDVELARGQGGNQKQSFSIIGVKPLETFKNIRENQLALSRAFYAAELILKSTADEQPNSELFDYFFEYLKHLNDQPDQNSEHSCINLFTFHALALTGYEVNFGNCVVCGKPLTDSKQIFFSNRKGGFVDSDCATKVSDAKLVSQSVFELLNKQASLLSQQINASDYAAFDQQAQTVPQKELIGLSKAFAEHMLERDLKSGRFMV